jgi:hypothetical protein
MFFETGSTAHAAGTPTLHIYAQVKQSFDTLKHISFGMRQCGCRSSHTHKQVHITSLILLVTGMRCALVTITKR